MPEIPMIGMKASTIVYLAVMCELCEERYGDQFISMCNSVQEEIMLLMGGVDLNYSVDCVRKKFDDPQYSIKQALLDAGKKSQRIDA